jgi:cell wall-associated NlpC family hydrolase
MYKYFILFILSVSILNAIPNTTILDDFKSHTQSFKPFLQFIKPYKFNSSNLFKNYYKPWSNKHLVKKNDIKWVFKLFKYKKGYSENYYHFSAKEAEYIIKNYNYYNFGKIKKNAISLNLLHLRVFPTDKPFTLSPEKAGEGLPFDYFQNSSIHSNSPIQVLNKSLDKEWVFVANNNVYGWVKEKEIAYISEKQKNIIKKSKKAFILEDKTTLINKKNDIFLTKVNIGTVLPIFKINKQNTIVLVANSDINHNLIFSKSFIENSKYSKKPLKFNKKNVSFILNQLLGINYGWGGIYNNRDCSSTLKDYFFIFGKILPRNSYQQSKIGKRLKLPEIEFNKIKFIKKNGIPFRTLIHKKGHILLYIGYIDNKIFVFHNIWGIKYYDINNIEKREIIGGSVITTLNIGSEFLKLNSKNSILLNDIDTINIIK